MIVAPRSQSLAAIMAKATVAARAAAAATLARSGKESTADVWSAVGRDVQVPAAFFTGSEPSGDAATYHRCRVTSHTVCQRWPPTGALAAAYFIEHEGVTYPVRATEMAHWLAASKVVVPGLQEDSDEELHLDEFVQEEDAAPVVVQSSGARKSREVTAALDDTRPAAEISDRIGVLIDELHGAPASAKGGARSSSGWTSSSRDFQEAYMATVPYNVRTVDDGVAELQLRNPRAQGAAMPRTLCLQSWLRPPPPPLL